MTQSNKYCYNLQFDIVNKLKIEINQFYLLLFEYYLM